MQFITLKVLYLSILNAMNLRDKRTSYVISGVTPSATGAGSLGISVATGTLVVNGTYVSYTAGSAGTAGANTSGNPRVDAIRFASGAVTPSIVAGTAAAQPVAPALGANDLLVGIAFIPNGATDFTAAGAYVEDMTMLRGEITTTQGDIIVADANGVPQRFAKGTGLQQLRVNAGATTLEYATIAGAAGGTPAVVLGTTNAAGVATTFLRDDDTILAFDATAPLAVGTAGAGAGAIASRSTHIHPTGAGTPVTQAFGDVASIGAGPAAAMTNHVHGMPSLASLSAQLGANVAAVTNTWTDVLTITLLANTTYAVMGSSHLSNDTGNWMDLRIQDTTNAVTVASNGSVPSATLAVAVACVGRIVVGGSNVTLKLQVNQGGGIGNALAAIINNATGNTATNLVAVKA